MYVSFYLLCLYGNPISFTSLQTEEKRGKSSEDDRLPSSLRSRSSQGVRSEEELESDIAEATQEVSRPTSTVKFAPHLEVTDIPSRSRSSLGPSRLSLMDEDGKPSRTSVLTGTEGMVFGRDAVIEREKINEEARNTFAVMDVRYEDMVQDLIDLDNAFELGLTVGNREDFEKTIQNVRIIKTPPTKKGERATVELAVRKETSVTEVSEKHIQGDTDTANHEKAPVDSKEDILKERDHPHVEMEQKETIESEEKHEIEHGVTKPENSESKLSVRATEIEIVVTQADDDADDADDENEVET